MSKIPSVFTGQDLISWMLANLDLCDAAEALMLANRMAASGYFFPIDDHVLQVKNDNTYYRFQVRMRPVKTGNRDCLVVFLRKLFHCKTSLQGGNVCRLNNVKILDFDQFDNSSIFMLKTMICRLIWRNLGSNSASHYKCYCIVTV